MRDGAGDGDGGRVEGFFFFISKENCFNVY